MCRRDILHSLFKRGWKFETEKRINRGLLFSTLLFSLGSTGEFSKAKATSPITIETQSQRERNYHFGTTSQQKIGKTSIANW